jgi:hypothetical protein
MPKSFRIRTNLNEDRNLQVKLEQNFDTLEVLSLTVTPDEIYTRNCSDFGVVCGRVFANNGFGIPNARVSIFIPLEEDDLYNDIISALYPYKTLQDVNDDGYRYNLLPYTSSHSGHIPVGTFPDRSDVLIDKNVIEVYDKYYKFTVQTNDSGDYMIFGLPVGNHELFMQVDLSDIGPFSQTPQDLIRMGRAIESQVDGDLFKTSTNFDELPQIVSLRRTITVSPFFGEAEICNYNIYRSDFDLTNEAAIKIEPTSVFMGSMFSTNDTQKIGYSRFLGIVGQNKCKSSIKMGNLCDLIAGPGSIEALRQTELLDENGLPILEEFKLDNGGKVIDENGVWVTEVPMNLDYVYTDEYGNQKISYNPNIGIPTRGKYRFKVKWQQSTKLSEEIKRAYYLVPNIKEYGWFNEGDDPIKKTYPETESTQQLSVGITTWSKTVSSSNIVRILSVKNVTSYKILNNDMVYYGKNLRPSTFPYQFTFEVEDVNEPIIIDYITMPLQKFLAEGSYAFSLDWNDYANYQDAIDCKDTFYDMSYNKVYTVSNLIDRFQTSKFVWNTTQIKYIQDSTCEGNYNKFPTNDSHYRLNFLWFFVSFVISVLPYLLFAIVAVVHVLSWVYDNILPIIDNIINKIRNVIEKICASVNKALGKLGLDSWKINCPDWDDINRPDNPFLNIGLPLVLYTDDGCERCRCNIANVTVASPLLTGSYGQTSILFDATSSNSYNFENILNATSYFVEGYGTPNQITNEKWRDGAGLVLAGNDDPELKETVNTPWAYYYDVQRDADSIILSSQLNMSSLYNLFNLKDKYFEKYLTSGGDQTYYTGWNQIKVKWQPQNNLPYDDTNGNHFDNVMMLVLDEGQGNLVSGDIVTFQDPSKSLDKNYNKGIASQTGTTGYTKAVTQLTVKYADPTITDGGPNANKTTTYTITGFNENIIWSIENPIGPGPSAPIITYASSTETGKYPMDIEYFQVLTGMTLGEFKSKSEEKQNPFTLGRRYLQIKDKSNQNIVRNNLYSISDSFTNKHQVILWSKDGGNMTNPAYPPVWTSQYLGVVEPSQDPTYLNKRVLILMRGVDVHSPSIDMKIDLSRIFGKWIYDWGPDFFSNKYVLEGKFKMNIPIQASLSTVGANSISSTNHYLLSNNNGASGGYDKTTKSTIFHKSYLFEYKSLGQNSFKSFDSHMHKYYSGVGPALIDGYSSLNWNTDLGSQYTSIINLLNQYKEQVLNRLYASGEESVPPNNGYYPTQSHYSITTKNLTVSENNFYRKRFFDVYYFNGENKYYGVNDIGTVTFSTVNFNNQFSLSNYIPNENIEGGEMIESSFGRDGNTYSFASAFSIPIKIPNQPIASINIFNNVLNGGLGDTFAYSVYKWGPNNSQDENGRRGAQMFSFDYFAPEDPTDISQGTYPIQFNSHQYTVVRTDRLPSSTTLNRFGANTMFLHQNPDFSVFKISEGGIDELTNLTQISVSENDGNELLTPEYEGVLQSVQDCSYAVLQKCYSFDPVKNVPVISENCQSYMSIGDIVKFRYGTGCYNLVSVSFDSFKTDIESIKEWAARLKMNLAVCLDVFSHTFSNQYINGTLYMYAFKNNRFFDSSNQPFSEYCTDVVYLNDYSNTFYYRGSPYMTDTNTINNGKFIGKPNPIGNSSETGNVRLLGSPTTILDLGPKVIYTQELVFSDDYDGYIMNRLKSTTYQGISQVMNMFILSRITSPTLSKLIVPQSDDPNEGDNDAGVQSLFQNTRWFKNPSNIETLIPQSVDGDLSQMLSINSEFGITEFSPENYPGDTVYFGFSNQGVINGFAMFGIFFTGNTQDRDFITPRRTIWNQNSTFPVNNDYDFTQIPVKTQVVPFYNWKISDFNNNGELQPTTIFGTQKNDWYTEKFGSSSAVYPNQFQSYGYQSMDRLNSSSRYFQSNIINNKTSYAQNYIINFNTTGGTTYQIPTNSNFSNYFIAGSPFHFYFGLVKGKSALDVFIKKYLNENSIVE